MTDAILDTSTVIVGQSGSGKTVTAKDQVTRLLGENRHTAIIDPTGVWWGMRLTPEGEPNRAQLYVFGGEHGDVAIRPTQGAEVARIILGQRISAVVDLSAMKTGAEWRLFAHDFVAELRGKPRGNFHLVVDEADEFAAQTPPDDVGFRLRENMVWIAKRGRVAGFVPTYITQRTAEIAKAVISQAQTLIAHQLIAPADQKAIDDYLKGHGSAEVRKEVMASLAELAIGERWIYSPRRKLLARGRTPALATFDSSRTPEPGEAPMQPRALAELDTSAIAAALAPAAEIPTSLTEAAARVSDVAALIEERDGRIGQLERELAEAKRIGDMLYSRGIVIGISRAEKLLGRLVEEENNGPTRPPVDAETARAIETGGVAAGSQGAGPSPLATGRQERGDADAPQEAPAGTPDAAVRGRKALDALVRIHPASVTEAEWAMLARLAKRGGTWSTYKNALRSAGLVEQDDGCWRATDAGVAASSEQPGHLPELGPDLAREWGKRIPGVGRMVGVLIDRWPHFVTREGLAADLNMASSGGTFSTYLSRLRGNGLIEEKGQRLRLSAAVMGKVP